MHNLRQASQIEVLYRSIPICETAEPLISISDISAKIKVFPYYYHHKIPGALEEVYLREGVARRLADAADKLPADHYFVVLDGWRPYAVQRALYESLKEEFRRKGMTESSILQELPRFVAYPSDDRNAPSPHMTGGSVDLTIASQDGWLDMGTEFDEFTDKAQTDWYEQLPAPGETEQRIRDNRRLLKQVMTEAGFMNFEEEWWHYDYGNQRWSMLTHQVAIYGGIKQ